MSMVNEKDSTSFRLSDGLRVLVIDADLTYLQTLAKMNQSCGYKVTTASRANDALSILGEDKSKFDIVITDINTTDMNGFQLIEIITQKMNLLVVIISAISDNDSIVKGINSGACDYLIKPVQMENIKLIWKHVVRKQRYGNFNALEQSKMLEKVENYCKRLSVLNSDERKKIRAGSLNSDKKEEKEDREKDDPASVKKPRMVWTSELHQQFVTVVDQIGVKNAVPKKILEMMNVDGLTRENVASHLQKYRLHVRKKDESMQQKVQMQSQAINFGLNSQMYSSYNLQNQVHPTQDQLQQLGQKRSNPIYSGYIPQFDQMNMDNYGAQENHFVKQENLSQDVPNLMEKDNLPPLDQFSSFRISDTGILGDVRSSLWRQRPYKLQKLNDNASSKVISDMIWHPTTTLSSAIIDVTKGLASEFCDQQDLSPLNGGNLYYASDRITDYTSDSAIEPIVFVQHYDQDDNGSYSEQFVGSLEAGYPTDDNTT